MLGRPTALSLLTEVVPACTIAGTGMIFAGSYLEWIKRASSENFDSRMLSLVPPLIGLKGNLEVTLSSRLSTMANIKKEFTGQAVNLFVTTLVFILIQAVAAGIIISLLSVLLFSSTSDWENVTGHFVRLASVSIFTCTLAICGLSLLVFGLIIFCTLVGTDPDNVAPPMAAALGDLATVTLLIKINDYYTTSPTLVTIFAVLAFTCILLIGPFYLIRQSRELALSTDLKTMSITWSTFASSVVPLMCAIVMSSLSGQVLAHFAHRLHNLARLQIAINGVGGCFGSIVVSRMTTRLNTYSKEPTSPPAGHYKVLESEACDPTVPRTTQPKATAKSNELPCVNILACFTKEHIDRVSSEVLSDAHLVSRFILFSCLPIHLFLAVVSFVLSGIFDITESEGLINTVFTPSTVGAYLLAAFIQVSIIIWFARRIVISYWGHLIQLQDPIVCCQLGQSIDQSPSLASLDLAAIALTTGLGDLLGSVLLVSTLYIFQT